MSATDISKSMALGMPAALAKHVDDTYGDAINTETIAGDKTFTGVADFTGGLEIGGVAVTSSAAELNIMDGVTATAAEINAACDQSGRIVASTDAGTLALAQATHGDRIVYFSDADGAITLPNATGSGARFKVVLKTAATSMTIKVTASTDEEFMGGVVGVDDDADAAYAWKAEDDDDTLSFNGTSTGGKVGDWVQFEDIATGLWLVSGFITQSGGSEATPFSATVSAA